MARNPFILKFRNKTPDELRLIIENPETYVPEAVDAAKLILGEIEVFEEVSPSDTLNQLTAPPAIKEERPKKKYKESKKSFHYIKNYQWSDFWTTCSLAFLWTALVILTRYYSGEPIFERISVIWLSIPISLTLPVFSHVFYRFDHGYSNNFLGRTMATSLLLTAFILLVVTHDYLSQGMFNLPLENFIEFLVFPMVIIGLSAAYEAGTWLIRSLLRAAGWDVL